MFSAGVLFAGVIGDTVGGVAQRSLASQDRQPGDGAPLRDRGGIPGRVRLPVAGGADSQSDGGGGVPVAGVLLRRADRGADLVRAHGHRAALRRLRQRHDELRLRRGRPGLAFQFRLPGGPHRQLGFPVRLLDAVAAGWGACWRRACGPTRRSSTRGSCWRYRPATGGLPPRTMPLSVTW